MRDYADAGVVNRVLPYLDDAATRNAAVEALGNLAGKVDQAVVTRLSGFLTASADPHLRLKTLKALGKLADKADAETISAIAGIYLHSRDVTEQTRAFSLLSTLYHMGKSIPVTGY
jgi:hypothetical protein